MSVKHIDICKGCKHHKGISDSFVRCNHLLDVNVWVISQPSFYNEGFKNGEVIVLCPID